MMPDDDSVSEWLVDILQGREESIPLLWQRYFPQLVRTAQQMLAAQRDPMAEAEDVALSALDSFFRAVQRGRFSCLEDRDGLWRLLSEMTRCKALDLIRRSNRAKRGGWAARREPAPRAGMESEPTAWGNVAAADPTPSLAMMLAEDCEHLLGALTAQLRNLATRKLEGYTNREIATQLGCSVATVERRLVIIRKTWQEVEPELRHVS